MIKVHIQKEWFTREAVEADPGRVYLFGENYAQQGGNYVPRSTQAVIRGLPNAIGIPTKHTPGRDAGAYLSDDDFAMFKKSTMRAISKAVSMGKPIVIPKDGIGTGAAMLPKLAPKCAAFISGVLLTLCFVAQGGRGPSSA